MPRLSVVIPVVGHASQMEDSLVSILENRPADCEILVMVNQAYSDPYELKDEVRFVQGRRGAQQVELINLGIRVSHAEVVHVLGCGIVVGEGWAETALDRFADRQVAAVAPVVVDRGNPRRCLAAGATYRHRSGVLRRGQSASALASSQNVLVDPVFLTAFYRRSALESVGLFSSACGRHLAGVDLGLALLEAGFHGLLEPACRLSAEPDRFVAPGGFRQGRAAEKLYQRWVPDEGRLGSMALHATAVAAEWGWNCYRPAAWTRLIGRAVGTIQRLASGRSERVSASQIAVPAVRLQGPHFAAERSGHRKSVDELPITRADE